MAMDEKIVEVIRDRFGGSEKGLEELLLLLPLLSGQPVDPNLPLYALLIGGRRSKTLALVAALAASQQQAQAAAATSGVAPQPVAPQSSTNLLVLAMALGLFGEEGEVREVKELEKRSRSA
jgi:hypothetical protein